MGNSSSKDNRCHRSSSNLSSSTPQLPKSSSYRSGSAGASRSNYTSKAVVPPPPYSAATEISVDVEHIRPPRRGNKISSPRPYTSDWYVFNWQGSGLRGYLLESKFEEARETLRDYDTVIIVDNSSSMYGRRWKEVSVVAQLVAAWSLW